MSPDDLALHGACCPDLPEDELAELAEELRTVWRALTRGAHLAGGTELPQRQQYWVLGVLADGPKRMSDIADWAQTSQASVTGIVDRLEERGFVERVRSDADRRVVRVGLTEAGRAELGCTRQQKADRLRSLLAPLDAEERQHLLHLFRKMTARVEPDTSNDR